MQYHKILGYYLLVHFIQLIPDSIEIFSNNGLIKNKTLLPAYGKIPNILFVYDNPTATKLFIFTLIIASIALIYKYNTRIVAAWLFYGWVCLFNRNIFIMNPSLAYIGWLLLTYIVDSNQDNTIIHHGAWVIAGLSYTVSGIHKLQCPSWIDGTALNHILTSPLSRNNFITKFLLNLPDSYLKIMTWTSLIAEISFLFLGLFKRLRKTYWLFFLIFHVGILLTINFTDLTVGMLVFHIYLYNTKWPKEIITKVNKTIDDIKHIVKESDISSNSSSLPNLQNKFIRFISIISNVLIWGYILFYICKNVNMFSNVIMNAAWGFGYLIMALGVVMTLEYLCPSIQLQHVNGWWLYVIMINIFQLFAVMLATVTWEKWLQQTSYFTGTTGFHLRDYVSPFIGGFIAYAVNQWVFYWWHYLRHQNYMLWLLFHQFHHSPTRIEAITSFYKHPLEIIVDSQIMAILVYAVLGLTAESSIWLSIFSGMGEYFYHMNLNTPRIIGYFFQRPESHRLHHGANKRINCPNYSDFVIWDILNDTFENPPEVNQPTGFPKVEEERIPMLLFRDVLRDFDIKFNLKQLLCYLLVFWGLFSSSAFLLHSDYALKANVLVSSPLPLVFTSYNGIETFSAKFDMSINVENNLACYSHNVDINDIYKKIKGSYNKRNVYGAMFAYGPLFTDATMTKLRDHILSNMCMTLKKDKYILPLHINATNTININTKSINSNRIWEIRTLSVDCGI